MTSSTPIAIALFTGKLDRLPQQKRLRWDRLTANLTTHVEREEKDGPLFSPTLYRDGATRGLAGVESVAALVLDFDRGTAPGELTPLWERFEYLTYSTHSSTPEHPKWRAVFPLAAPVPTDEWPRVHRNLATALGQGHTDPSCKDASRIYYLPSHPSGAAPFASHHPGEWLDPAAFPDIEEPRPQPAVTVPEGPIVIQDGRLAPATLITRALGEMGAGRNNAGLWLACQLRDNGYPFDEAETVMQAWWALVPQDGEPYTPGEALHSLGQAYQKPPRSAWEQSRPIPLQKREQPENLAALTQQASEAVAAFKKDPESLFTPEALAALANVRRWDPVAWARLKVSLLRGRAPIVEVEKALDAVLPQEEVAAPVERLLTAGEMLDGCPVPELLIPHPYQVRLSGTGKMAADEERGPHFAQFAYGPILLAGRARDTLTGQESLLLTWRWPEGGWRYRIVDRAGALVKKRVAELASYGFPYIEKHDKELVAYLSQLEAANRLTLPCARVSSHLGWQGNVDEAPFLIGKRLILPDGSAEETGALDAEKPETWREGRVMFHGLSEGEQQLVSAFGSAGTYQGWVDAINLIRPFPRAMIIFYAAFCAPLLQLFNVPNFIVDLSHATTTGKTTSLRAAGSVWGNPDERTPASVVKTWDLTRVAIERMSHTLSGLPLILDDSKRATSKNEKIIAELIYTVVHGQGRGRGTIQGIAATSHWRTVVLSTGEQALVSFTQDGGTRTRVLCIVGLPFDRRDLETGQIAKLINRQLCEHHGHAGVRFIAWLMKERPRWDAWRGRYQEWVDYYSQQPPTPEAGRLAQYAALVTLAGAMAHEALQLPWEYENPLRQLWAEVAAAAGDASGEERALRDVLSWAFAHEKTFHGRVPADAFGHEKIGPIEMSGRWDAEKWKHLAFFPLKLREILSAAGYYPESILVGWRERGWLDHKPGGFTVRMRAGQELAHMIAIHREAIAALDDEGGTRGEHVQA